MSSNTRRSRRRAASILRSNRKSWFRRYLKALSTGVAAASIGTVGLLGQPVQAANDVWIGNTSTLWNVPANWSTAPAGPVTGDTLQFGLPGSSGNTLSDNLMTAATFNVAGITFDSAVPAYIINPGTAGTNGFTLTGGITDNSTNVQTINDDIVMTGVRTVTTIPGASVVLGGNITGTGGGFTVTGGGSLTLSGTANYTGATNVAAGVLNMNAVAGATAALGAITVGNTSNLNAVMNISKDITSSGTVAFGGVQNAATQTANGAGFQTGGNFNSTTAASTNAFQLGAGPGGYGYYKLSGGTLSTNEIGIGGGQGTTTGAIGVMDITGGTFNEQGWITMARGTGQIGILNVNGGTVNAGLNAGIGGRISLGLGGGTSTAIINITNGSLNGPARTGYNLAITDSNAGMLGEVNVNANGTLTIGAITGSGTASTALLNFNGGTLKAATSNGGFMTNNNVTGVFVYSGGATIDNNGFAISISNPLQAPAGSGVNAIAVTDGGSGYIGAPAVTIAGGAGLGAAAVANMISDGQGGLKIGSITVTNRGSGYAPGDSVTVTVSGGGASAPAAIGNVTFSANVGGGVTFAGSNVTTLTSGGGANQSGASTYSGPTAITAGTLSFTGAASINGSSGVAVGTASTSATLLHNSSTAMSAPVTLTNGTVNGTGTINSLTIANLATNTLANGSNGVVSLAQPITIGNLTFSGAAGLNPVTSLAQASTAAVGTTTLIANGAAGSVKVTPTNTSGGWSNGTYHLVSCTGASIGGTGFPTFALNITGIGTRQTVAMTNPAGFIDLVIGGNSAVWTGAASNAWTTGVIASPKNWALSSNSAATDYVAGDAVIFDDSASGTTSVNVTDATVLPALMSFNNSSKNYTISGNPITGTGGAILNGTGSVTFNGANTFSGGMVVNAGTLNFGLPNASNTATASAIGTGRLTLNQGVTIDNTSGGAATVLTGNLQTWNGDFNFTGTNDLNLGTGAVTANLPTSPANAGTLTINTAAHTLTIGGNVTGNGTMGLFKTGPGVLAFNGGGTIPGQSTVGQGKLVVSGGTMSFTRGAAPSLSAGFAANTDTSIVVTGGTMNTTSELWLGANAGSYGSLTNNGGTVNVGSWLALGRAQSGQTAGQGQAGIGIVNANGGTITIQSNNLTIGSFGNQGGGGIGLVNVNAGGTVATTGNTGIYAGEWFPGSINVMGNGTTQATVNISNNGNAAATGNTGLELAVQGVNPSGNANLGRVGSTGINNNGLIITPRVFQGAGIGTFNFHGGTLRANSTNAAIAAAFMQGITNTYIYGEGAVIDTNAINITIAQQLKPPTGSGIAFNADGTVAGLTVSGGGFTDTPYVQVSGGDGTGASAIAVIDYATGNLTGIRLTNPGVGYTTAPTFTLIGGGPGNTGAIAGTPSLAPNITTGGLTKVGTGTLILSGNNTYTGGTTVNAGTLALNFPSGIGTGALNIGAAGAAIDNTSGSPVTITNSTNANFDFAFGGTRNLTLSGPFSLGNQAGATRTITTNAATAGTSLTISSSIVNGTNGTTPTTGLAKAGTGTLVLSGNNAFTGSLGVSAGTLLVTGTNALTGATSVTGGTLQIDGSGAINNSSGITVNAAGAKLLQTGSVSIAAPVTLTLGTVDGTGTINTLTAANAAGAIINHGNGTSLPLTINNLTFNGAATMNVLTSPTTASTAKFNTTAVATNAAAKVSINSVNSLGYWEPGAYREITYTGSIGGAGFSGFQTGTTPGLGGRQTATLDNSTAGQVNLVIGGDRAVWTGALNGNWDATTAAAPKNWKKSSDNSATDFLANDSTFFDDSATNTTVNVAANVTPANAIFGNITKNFTIQSGGTFGIGGSALLVKNGAGALTINNANTYTGGTTLTAGTLKIGNAAAIGTGRLTLSGGTIDNSTGAALTMTTNTPETWNGNFTFAGTSDLNLGTGTVTLGADSTATIAAGDLTVGPMATAATSPTAGLTKAGPGTLTINSTGAASTIGGTLNVTGGLFQIALPGQGVANNFTAGGLTGGGTIENGSNGATTAASTLVINNNADNVFSGLLQDGSGGARLGLTKGGSGKLTLSGNSTLSNGINVTSGELVLTGAINPAQSGTIGQNTVSGTAAPTAVMTLANGSTLISPKTNAPSFQAGGGAGTVGVLRVNAGSTLNAASELWLATADGGYGAMDMTGGTVNIGSWLALGRGGGQGILNQSGGSLTVLTNQLTIGSFGGATGNGVVHGQVNLSGGTLTTTNNAYAGEQTNGVLNVSGTGRLITGAAVRLALTNASTLGIVNLLPGGTITTNQVQQGAGQGVFNFHGGTLQAATDTATFMTSIGAAGTFNAYAYPENAVLDTNGHQVFMDLPIQAPTGNGVSATGLTVSGGGYASTPVVQITGGGGTGATANAVIDANGNLTGIKITNPGVGYTSAPTIALLGGGIGNTGRITGTPTLVANTSGGLTKVGAGVLTISGLSTYTGPTTVKQGTLTVGVPGAVPTGSAIVMAGGIFNTGGIAGQFGQLQVADNSGIDLGFGGGVFNFANSTATPWAAGKAVSIINWSGTPNATGGADQLVFDSAGLTAAQIAAVHFQGFNGAVFKGNELVPVSVSTRKLGDVTGDAHVNAADVTAMLSLLTDISGYRASRGLSLDDMLNSADIDSSGNVTNTDLQGLITYLLNGNGSVAPVPEPGTLVLLVCGAIPGVWLARSWRKNKGENA